jgi:C1A family cysteine protease
MGINMAFTFTTIIKPLPFDLNITPVLGHRDEPEELAEKHWSFEDRMKSALTSPPSMASDLRGYASPRHNQYNSSSCAAQSVIKIQELLRIKRYGKAAHVDLSRLANYFLARELMSPPETNKDGGSYITGNAEVSRRFGVCSEDLWPFDLRLILKSPPWSVMRSAYKNKIAGWTQIKSSGSNRVNDVILSLVNGIPVAYGTDVGLNWRAYTSNSEPLGLPAEKLGRHATVIEGWDPQKEVFLCENSWGNSWGQDGFYELRPEVVEASTSGSFVCITDDINKLVIV